MNRHNKSLSDIRLKRFMLGGDFLSDKMMEVYSAYDMDIYQTMRGRGAIVLKTDKGVFQMKQLDTNERRLTAEYEFKEKLYESGFKNIDRCVPNNQEELITYDRYGNPYVLRQFFEGKECNVMNEDEVLAAVDNLAYLHITGKQVFDNTEVDVHIRVNDDFKKRNRELRRVKNFIIKQSPKKEFEDVYIRAYEYFYNQALSCENQRDDNMKNASLHLGYCHGMYNHHSVILHRKTDDRLVVSTINFDKFYVGNQLSDLYHFSRKVVEKNGYDFSILKKIISRYSELCPMTAFDIDYIYRLYRYPEKFYKISNQYMNSAKNWISPKMLEKLNKVIDDEDKKQELLDTLYTYKQEFH